MRALTIVYILLACTVAGYSQTTATYDNVRARQQLTLNGHTLTSVLQTIDSLSTHAQGVTAKAVYDYIATKYSTVSAGTGIDVLKAGSNYTISLDTLKRLHFRTDSTYSGGVGTMRWNLTDGTLDLGLLGGNVTLQLGQESVQRVKNADNSGLVEGNVVYIVGSSGDNLTVRYARANAESTSANTFGVMTESASGGDKAFCTTFGLVRNINTSNLTEGGMVWLSKDTAGSMTAVRPTAPNHGVEIGFCVRKHATAGVIFVTIQNGYELRELHDVYAPSPSNNQGLLWKSANSRWEAAEVDTSLNNEGRLKGNKPSSNLYYDIGSTTTGSVPITLYKGTGIGFDGTSGSPEGGSLTINNTGDLDNSNEGTLGVGAGTSTSSVITSNTSGASGVTLNAGGGISISETTSSNGGSITLSATDQSITNEGILGVATNPGADAWLRSNTSTANDIGLVGTNNTTISATASSNGGQIVIDSKAKLDTFSLSGQTLRASLLNDGVATSSVTLPIVDVVAGTNVTISKANGVATVNALASQLSGVTGYVSQFNSSTTIDTTGMFWNGRLGIGTASPAARFHTVGSGNTSGTWTAQFHNSAGNNNALMIRDDGNVGIGTNTPNAKLTIQGTTATDGGQLGAELLSAAGWTSADWTGDYSTGFTHTTGYTTSLTNTLAAVSGEYYQIAYTVSGRTAGSFVVSFGGLSTSNITASGSFGPRATSTASLSVTPTSDFDGTIIFSIRLISNRSALLTLYNSAGVATNQILANTSTTNTAVGLASMVKITTGVANTAFGQSAMANTTTGSNNIAFGFSALASNTTGSSNVAMGSNALLSNTFGGSNTAIGAQALSANTTGVSNTAIGIVALTANTTGSNNVSIGAFSSVQNTTGTANIAIGVNALERNTTGNDNIALGRLAIFNNTTGYYNTVVGRSAGANSTTALTGSSNTLIGYSSAANIEGAASGNLVIGNSINLPTANGSNQINIKNIIFATGASGTGDAIAGSVGVGVNAPTGRLNIRGENASSGTNTFLVQNSTPSDLYKIENNGKISYWATNTAAGTTGAQTINRPSGTVNFAAGTTALVVTNSLCTTTSIVFATVRTNDSTAYIKNVVPGSGSFTINLGAAATAETSVGFFIIN